MIYLFIDKAHLKLLYLKKTFMGQYETKTFYKEFPTDLLVDGKVQSVDVVASAIKEAFQQTLTGNASDKEIFLILPQKSFAFLRTTVPSDIAPSAVTTFVKEKARATLNIDLDNSLYDCFIEEVNTERHLSLFAISHDTWAPFLEVFKLLELKVVAALPETLAYYKLFKKTLRKDKKEIIMYVHYETNHLKGYLYDSLGLLLAEPWEAEITPKKTVEVLLKDVAEEFEKNNQKLNRIILSGEGSDTIRQDTFTKDVGVWTNPLKRIIPNFYEEYLKMLNIGPGTSFPLLALDVCVGAFIFSQENAVSILKRSKTKTATPMTMPRLPMKEIGIFIVSFAISFGVFALVSKIQPTQLLSKLPLPATPTPTQPPKPTSLPVSPTPSVDKTKLKIKVLNGSGVAGQATKVKDLLKEKGYEDILTGNADNFDFKQSEVQVKKGEESIANLLKNDIKASTTTVKITTSLAKDDAADAILIFGADFK